MNNKLFYITSVLVVGILLSGCSSAPGASVEINDDMGKAETVKELEKMSEIIESGKPAKCLVKSTIEGEAANLTYWFKDGKFRMEGSFMPGQNMLFIEKDETSYMEPSMLGGMETDCEWITSESLQEDDSYDAEDEDMDFDYEQFEDNTDYEVICDYVPFGDEKFDTSGKTCTMEEVMGMDFGAFGDLGEF